MSHSSQGPLNFDCHMHTPLCGHAYGHPLEYVKVASERGLDLITFTCHIPMGGVAFSQEGIRMRREELQNYREMVIMARAQGEKLGVKVLHGIEAEIFPDQEVMENMEEILQEESFDFVLGSLHHMLPAWKNRMIDRGCFTDESKITEYFKSLGEGAASGRYHSLSHPDVIRVYSTLNGSFDPRRHESVIKDCLDAVAESETCLEINTSGLVKGDYVVHPDPLIAEWAIERKIPFTIGSDAHVPDRVGESFEEVIEEFHSLGLRELNYFEAGKKITIPLKIPIQSQS